MYENQPSKQKENLKAQECSKGLSQYFPCIIILNAINKFVVLDKHLQIIHFHT